MMRLAQLLVMLFGMVTLFAVLTVAQMPPGMQMPEIPEEPKRKKRKRKKRSLRKQHHLTKQELKEIEAAWDEEDYDDMSAEEKKWAWVKNEEGEVRPPPPTGKTDMVWVTVEKSRGVPYETKEEVQKVAGEWVSKMKTGGLHMPAFPIDNQKILYQVDSGFRSMFQLKDFLMKQPETKVFEWDKTKYYPPGREPNEEELAEEAADEAEKDAKRKKMQQKNKEKKEKADKRDEIRELRRIAREAKERGEDPKEAIRKFKGENDPDVDENSEDHTHEEL